MTNLDEKLEALLSKEKGVTWLEAANWRFENKDWLKLSQKIAMKILDRLDELDLTQNELVNLMGVSDLEMNKIVQGKENLSLETIAKLSNVLKMELIIV